MEILRFRLALMKDGREGEEHEMSLKLMTADFHEKSNHVASFRLRARAGRVQTLEPQESFIHPRPHWARFRSVLQL
jgi:hypothetical protein